MTRPNKSAKILHPKSQTKAEINARLEVEEKLRGNPEKIKPSSRLNSNQKKIFNYVVSELEASRILGNLDSYILELGAIAIDRLQAIERILNEDFDSIRDKELMSAKRAYTQDFLKFVTEACLSPQSRAKMGVMTANKQQEDADPLLKILKAKSS